MIAELSVMIATSVAMTWSSIGSRYRPGVLVPFSTIAVLYSPGRTERERQATNA
jgi:hypothetical protein